MKVYRYTSIEVVQCTWQSYNVTVQPFNMLEFNMIEYQRVPRTCTTETPQLSFAVNALRHHNDVGGLQTRCNCARQTLWK